MGRRLPIEGLAGVRLVLRSSGLGDLETPRGAGEEDRLGATIGVLTLFRKDPEAATDSALFKFFFFF